MKNSASIGIKGKNKSALFFMLIFGNIRTDQDTEGYKMKFLQSSVRSAGVGLVDPSRTDEQPTQVVMGHAHWPLDDQAYVIGPYRRRV